MRFFLSLLVAATAGWLVGGLLPRRSRKPRYNPQAWAMMPHPTQPMAVPPVQQVPFPSTLPFRLPKPSEN